MAPEQEEEFEDSAWCNRCNRDIAFCICRCEECGKDMAEEMRPGDKLCSGCAEKAMDHIVAQTDETERSMREDPDSLHGGSDGERFGPAGLFSTDNPQSDRMQILAEQGGDDYDEDRRGEFDE